MNTFEERIANGSAHERLVIQMLEEREWTVTAFGQGMLPDAIRAGLRQTQSPMRWMPDILAYRSNDGMVVCIDAKAGETWRRTGNHDVETAALDAAERWEIYSGQPYYFVFADGGVLTPAEIREQSKPGWFRGNGSGTPFVLVSAGSCSPFDAVFGFAQDQQLAA